MTKMKKAIRDSGLRQDWLAAKIGISAATLSHCVGGRRAMSAPVLRKLAKLLGVTQKSLIG